jgi:hypothetical protein
MPAVRQMFNDDEANNLQVLYHCLPSPFFYSTTAADQLTANHVVFNNDVYNTPSYLPCAADMVGLVRLWVFPALIYPASHNATDLNGTSSSRLWVRDAAPPNYVKLQVNVFLLFLSDI